MRAPAGPFLKWAGGKARLAPHLGDGDCLVLTGASRTADIEKQIVRGIHGSEELAVVLGRAAEDGARG